MKPFKTFFMRHSVTGGYTSSTPFQAPARIRLIGILLGMGVLDANNGSVSFFHLVPSKIPDGETPLTGANILATILSVTNVATAVGIAHSSQLTYSPLWHDMIAGELVWLFGGCSGTTAVAHACLHYETR